MALVHTTRGAAGGKSHPAVVVDNDWQDALCQAMQDNVVSPQRKEDFALIDELNEIRLRNKWPVTTLSRVLSIKTNTLYKWLNHETYPSRHNMSILKERLDEIKVLYDTKKKKARK